MNGSYPEALPPLGRKIEPPKPAEPEPQWTPLQPGHETNGSAVRRTPGSLTANPWEKYMKALGIPTP